MEYKRTDPVRVYAPPGANTTIPENFPLPGRSIRDWSRICWNRLRRSTSTATRRVSRPEFGIMKQPKDSAVSWPPVFVLKNSRIWTTDIFVPMLNI